MTGRGRALGKWLAFVVGCALWLAAGTARAQALDDANRSAARSLGNDGVKAFQAGDYVSADQKLDKAYRILKAPSLGLWSARARAKLGRLVEASERYLEVTRLSVSGGDEKVQKQAQADAQEELDALAPRVPSIVVELVGAAPAETQVSIDGVPIAPELIGERRPTDPGKHVVRGVRGAENVESNVVLVEGDQKSVRLTFTSQASADAGASSGSAVGPAASPTDGGTDPGKTQRLIGWVTLGAGGVGLAVGTTLGVLAMSKHSELEDSGSCRGDECLRSASDDVEELRTQRTISTVGFVAGATLAVTGVVLVLTAPKSAARSALRFTPGGMSFEETF